MGKIRPGNAANSKLNGEWARHVRPVWKRITSGIRRLEGKKSIWKEMKENDWKSCSEKMYQSKEKNRAGSNLQTFEYQE